jgi:hypothetical protein
MADVVDGGARKVESFVIVVGMISTCMPHFIESITGDTTTVQRRGNSTVGSSIELRPHRQPVLITEARNLLLFQTYKGCMLSCASNIDGAFYCDFIVIFSLPMAQSGQQAPVRFRARHRGSARVLHPVETTATITEPVKFQDWSHITNIPARRKVQNLNAQVLTQTWSTLT